MLYDRKTLASERNPVSLPTCFVNGSSASTASAFSGTEFVSSVAFVIGKEGGDLVISRHDNLENDVTVDIIASDPACLSKLNLSCDSRPYVEVTYDSDEDTTHICLVAQGRNHVSHKVCVALQGDPYDVQEWGIELEDGVFARTFTQRDAAGNIMIYCH